MKEAEMQEFCALYTVTCAEIEQKIATPTRATARPRHVLAYSYADRIEAVAPHPPWSSLSLSGGQTIRGKIHLGYP